MMGDLISSLRRFSSELRRRHVVRVAVVYGLVAWVIIQVADTTFPALHLPEWTMTLVTVLAIMGFPLALILAWAFEITPEGVRRTPPETAPSPGEDTVSDLLHRIGGRDGPGEPAGRGRGQAASAARASGTTASGPEASGPVLEKDRLEEPDPERVRHASLAHLRHDLRTPIGVIVGYAEMLLEDAREAGWEEDLEQLEKLRAAGRQLQETVEDALDPRRGPPEGEEGEDFAERFRYELRDDLNAVIGYGELVLERCRETGREELAPDLERVLEASRRLLERSGEIVELFASDGTDEAERLDGVSEIAREALARIGRVGEGARRQEVRAGSLLVVDDNAMNRSLMARQLARQGYTVSVAEDGAEALERMEVQDFDLVLLDILMPRVDGIEVLRRMRSSPELRDVPVIMTSSLDEVDSAVRCLEAGADDYVARPVDPAILRARVASRLEAQRMRERDREQRERLAAQSELLDRLLARRLPDAVADRVLSGDTGVAESIEEATVLAVQLVGLDAGASRRQPVDFVRTVTRCLDACREIGARHGVEAFLPRGDGFLAAAGVPSPREDHAAAAAETALDLAAGMDRLAGDLGLPLQVRTGIHSGRAVAGMVGGEALEFDLWGEAPAVARELCREGEVGTIRVSPATYAHLRGGYRLRRRGVVDVTGRAQMEVYVLEGKEGEE